MLPKKSVLRSSNPSTGLHLNSPPPKRTSYVAEVLLDVMIMKTLHSAANSKVFVFFSLFPIKLLSMICVTS